MKRFLHFILLAACFITTAQVFAATRTVYFYNQNNWTEVHAYTWNSLNGNENNGWPGEKITKTNSDNLFVYEINNDAFDMIIFNNGKDGSDKQQTNNLKIIDGKEYYQFSYNGNSKTVYLDNSETQWDNVYIYYWIGKDNNNWPGLKIRKSSNNIYTAEIPEDATGFIFNNNNGSQTANLTDPTPIYHGEKGSTKFNSTLSVYVIGDIKLFDDSEAHIWANNWDGAQMTYEGEGIYKIERLEMLPNNYTQELQKDFKPCLFRLISKLNSNWDDNGNNYGPSNDNKTFVQGFASNFKIEVGKSNNNWSFATSKISDHFDTIDLTLDVINGTLSSNYSTGVESISEDNTNAPAEYFNLQGVKVNNPENGLYIVRQGNKVSKQYIR